MAIRDHSDAGTHAVKTNVRLSVADVPAGNPIWHFCQIYNGLRDADGFIPRAAFDPINHVRVLPYIQLFQEVDEGRFLCRLMGTEVVRLLGGEFTGRYLEEYVFGPVLAERLAELQECLASGRPVYSQSLLPFQEREHLTVVRGAFPCRLGDTRMVFLPLAPVGVDI